MTQNFALPYYPRPKMLSLSECVYHTKNCTKCGQIKTRDEFGPDRRTQTGLNSWCQQCKCNFAKIYYKTAHGRQKQKDYKKLDHVKIRRNNTQKKRYNTDLKFKMRRILSARLCIALHHTKHGRALKHSRTLDMLGCTIDFFMQHIEQQFQPGMTWQNHGQWHIDHIKPCASFDLTDPAQQKTCFNFSNMQPLWAEDNMKKGCRLHANTV